MTPTKRTAAGPPRPSCPAGPGLLLALWLASAPASAAQGAAPVSTGAAPGSTGAAPVSTGAAPADVASYEAIDAALRGGLAVPSGAEWRYFPGTAEPSPGLEWTTPAFDDSAWASGPSPFVAGRRTGGTRIAELEQGATTLYLRYRLDLPDLDAYARIQLELPIDDGFVFYLDGKEERRLHANDANLRLGHDAYATSEREWETPPVPQVDLKNKLTAGAHVLALQALVHPSDVESFGIAPVVRVVHRVTADGERARLATLRALLPDEDDEARRAYLEGRHLQRQDDHAGALPHLERAAELDPHAALPWARLVEAHRELGTLEAFDAELRALLGTARDTPAMREAWMSFFLVDLARSPIELGDLGQVPPLPDGAAAGPRFADASWVGHELANGRPLRIDCGRQPEGDGGLGGGDTDGWGPDRCFSPETTAVATDGDGLLSTVRVCTRSLDELAPAYRIPLPRGAYELRLALGGSDGATVAPGESVFDVVVEGARVLVDYDLAESAGRHGLDLRRIAVEVSDGFLDLDLLPVSPRTPWLAGLEVTPLSRARFLERAEHAVNASASPGAFELGQLARARALNGDADGALEAFERAEPRPGFLPADRAWLAQLRDALLPRLTSFAGVDDLVRRRAGEGPALLLAAREAGSEGALVTYLEGRLHQLAGRLDEALGAFESLVADGSEHPAPYLRMSECMLAVGLGAEAEGLLTEALSAGVAPTPELLQLWISLALGAGERDPWELVAALRELDVPERLLTVPTSKEAPREWQYSLREPTTTTWSRPTYDASAWAVGPGALGAGHVEGGAARTLWNIETVFARRTFELPGGAMLYPHVLVNANDAGDVYLNGTRVANVGVATGGYLTMPLRGSALPAAAGSPNEAGLVDGRNVLGIYGFNVRDAGHYDAGLVQPLGDLLWIDERLREDGVLRLNCGGDEFEGPDGETWYADRFHGWALAQYFTEDEVRPEIHGTSNDELYASNRWFYEDSKSTWYQVPLPDGTYHVTLHFAELEDEPRTFDVLLEEAAVLEDYSPGAAAGLLTAAVHAFDVTVTDGWLDLRAFDETDRPFLSGIEIAR